MKNLKILIAEDDEVSQLYISKIVKQFSKEILTVETGIDAVEICCNQPDIDLILMDIKMPEMDGHEAIRQIRLFNPNIVIFAQTAYVLYHDKAKALSAGCNEYLAKPFGQSQLTTLMEKYF